MADGRLAVGRFADPVAAQLLSPAELEPVLAARADERRDDSRATHGRATETRSTAGRQRYLIEAVTACAEVVVPRTVLLDQLLAESLSEIAAAQVVLLGAGLDGRPWRAAVLAGRPVFSVDHPASQADLRRRSATLGEPPIDLRYVPVDLAVDALAPALAAAGHEPDRPTVWLWEGVVPYLSAAAVESTVAALAEASSPGSALLVNYQSPSVTALAGRWVSAVLTRLARVDNPLSDEPWKSAWSPDDFATLLRRHGFAVRSDESLLQVAQRIGSPTGHSRSLANGRVALAVREPDRDRSPRS